MLACPHCAAALSRADLASRRFLRPRQCAACNGEYIEGGTGIAMAIVAAGAGVATGIGAVAPVPAWAPAVIAFGGALAGVAYTQSQPPQPASAVRGVLLRTLVLAPITALVVRWLMNQVAAR